MVPIARLERAIRPDSLAPPIGTVCSEAELAACFGLDVVRPQSDRYGGHLFVFVTAKRQLVEPDRLAFEGVTPRPAETAYVLAKRDDSYQYLGVSQQTAERGVWSVPTVDFPTWRMWGEGAKRIATTSGRRSRDGAASGRRLGRDVGRSPAADAQ
jgi:hypothetical protein